MAELSEEHIKIALSEITVPGDRGNIVQSGHLSGIAIKDGLVQISIETTPEKIEEMEEVRQLCEKKISEIPEVLNTTVVLTSERPPQASKASPPKDKPTKNLTLPGVESIIAVASGKGGVGKSTTSVNLSVAFSKLGKKVGLLDADIYGPSIPRMMGIKDKPQQTQNKQLLPPENFGIRCMSMGMLVAEEEPMIWRGPMVMGALQQMLSEVEWAPLDILVIDLPPGTGDAQLTLAQQTRISGAIIVSTPQDIALLDARKGLNMFRKVSVPILGIIENMSYFICDNCGTTHEIFNRDGALNTAKTENVDFLGAIPLDTKIRETSDNGQPIVISDPESSHANSYMEIAKKVINSLGET